jgi:hypothetical protein
MLATALVIGGLILACPSPLCRWLVSPIRA